MGGKSPSKDQLVEMKVLSENGHSPTKIAQQLGFSHNTVIKWLKSDKFNDPDIKEAVEELSAGFKDVAKRSIEKITDDKLEKMSAYQLAGIANLSNQAAERIEENRQKNLFAGEYSLTALLVHATRRREELLIPFPKITTVDKPPVYDDE